jgi:hypothetical protein
MTIRESIIHFQDKQGISNLTLCKDCEINNTTYASFRNGKRPLPYDQLQRIFDFLNLKIIE